MEQTEPFKNAEIFIQSIEKKLALCENYKEMCEASAVEVEREIDEHFARCFNALAARKDALIREFRQKIDNYKENVEESSVKLKSAFTASTKAKETALIMHPLNEKFAEEMCLGLKNIQTPSVFQATISTELSRSVLDAIQSHGKVSVSTMFSVVESVTTFAGSDSSIELPMAVCWNPSDSCFYVSEHETNRIKKITMQGAVSTFAEDNTTLNGPYDLIVHENTFYVTNHDANTISKISSSGEISIFAGSGEAGHADGVGRNASFSGPMGITMDKSTGNMFVTDVDNHLIRKITLQGEVSTVAGSLPAEDGVIFGELGKLWFDEPSQSLLVCDYSFDELLRVDLNGAVYTLCEVQSPISVVTSANRTIIVLSSSAIYKVIQIGQKYEAIMLAGRLKELEEEGEEKEGPFEGLPAHCFSHPYGLAVHEPSHSCFVADTDTNLIRKIKFRDPL